MPIIAQAGTNSKVFPRGCNFFRLDAIMTAEEYKEVERVDDRSSRDTGCCYHEGGAVRAAGMDE